MTQASGGKIDPARAIVDAAQASLSLDAFLQELLGIFDAAIGVDTAIAALGGFNTPIIPYQSDERQVALAERSVEFAKTRYAADILPVFAHALRVGACLDSEFYSSDGARERSMYHREVIAPAGIRSMLQICARWQGRQLLRLNLNRHGSQAFRRADLDAVLRLLPTLEAAAAARFAAEPNPALRELTPREMEIAEFVARGLTTAQIGVALGTSPYTVRNQLTRIFDKLQIESRAELAAFVAPPRN